MRIQLAVAVAVISASALAAVPGDAVAQSGCQPTIMQPCTNAPARPNSQPIQRNSVRGAADKDDDPKDHSPRLQVDKDTEFKFGTGGIGLGRKF